MIWVESSHYLFCGASIVSLKREKAINMPLVLRQHCDSERIAAPSSKQER